MLDNISKSMAIKIQHQNTEIKIQKIQKFNTVASTRVPVLNNTAVLMSAGQIFLNLQWLTTAVQTRKNVGQNAYFST